MRFGILTSGQEGDSRLVSVAERRGHTAKLINILDCSMRVSTDVPLIYYDGKKISASDFDVIVPRINVEFTDYGLNVLRQFQSMGVKTIDNAYSIELGRDKLRCLQYMMRFGLAFPTTGLVHSKEDFDTAMQTIGNLPIVIKLIKGTEGVGVFLVEDKKQALNILKTFQQLDAQIILQEFIAESAGTDLRCFVVGGKVIAAMQRKSQDEDFRANISLGGKSEAVELTSAEEKLAIDAAQAVNLNVAGVDIIRSDRGPLVIEINVSPDFSALEEVSGVDVAEEIIKFGEEIQDENI